MTGEAIAIRYSPEKITWLLLLSTSCFVVAFLCFCFAPWFGQERMAWVRIAGATGMLPFAAVFCIALYKFYIKKPAIVLYNDGFVYNRSNTKTQFVYWSEVQSIGPVPGYGTLHITLVPQKEITGSSHAKIIVIPASLFIKSVDALYIIVAKQWAAYKKQVADEAAQLALAPILKIKGAEASITTKEVIPVLCMPVESIIGKTILDILVQTDYNEEYYLDIVTYFLFLDGNIAIEIPANRSKNILSTTIATKAESIFFSSWGNASSPLRNRRIVDVIFYQGSSDDKALLELDNGYFITEKNIAPREMGIVGLKVYDSIACIEKRYGKDYVRWSATKIT